MHGNAKARRWAFLGRRWAIAALGLGLLPWPSRAAPAATEAQVKAALLYNFAKFVEWPAYTAIGPLVIGVYREPDLADALSRSIAGKRIGARRVEIRSFHTLDQLQLCHLLFVSSGHHAELARVLHVTSRAPVVTVGDGRQFVRAGGTIGVFFEQRKPRFDINVAAAHKSGVKIRAQLLQLAREVRR